MKKFKSFFNLKGIVIPMLVAIVATMCSYGHKSDNDAFTIAGIVLGILLIVIIGLKEPVMYALYKTRVRDFIEGVSQPFIRVNSVNWKVLELLPNIDRIRAKHIVYNRRHLGKYKTLDDFFNINLIPEHEREAIAKYIII